MKIFDRFFIGILVMLCWPITVMAQDVIIEVPASNIFNRTELTTVRKILNTRDNDHWRIQPATWPRIQSTSGNTFKHITLSGKFITNEVLLWRLASIGGKSAPFHSNDLWPVFKWFDSSERPWYEPSYRLNYYIPGDVLFTFKILSDKFEENTFNAGDYYMDLTHNYIGPSIYVIRFDPYTLKVILRVSPAIIWLTNTPTKYIEISSLSDYRSTSEHILGDLVPAEIGNTVDFNLSAKASSTNIHFTSSKGVTGSREISKIQLGSTESELTKKALSANSKNFSSSVFGVKLGNRNNFTPQLSISSSDFKQHFFEAGTYSFQLNLDAKSTSGTSPAISALQNMDVTLKVLPLSEITIPTSGQTVNFDFNTSAHYSQGQTKVMPNQIKLSNNETFELYVKSDQNYFKKGGIQTDINSNILQIGVDASSLNVPLSTTPQQIIQSGTPVLDQELNMKYTIPALAAKTLVAKEKSTYSINIIYSFTAL